MEDHDVRLFYLELEQIARKKNLSFAQPHYTVPENRGLKIKGKSTQDSDKRVRRSLMVTLVDKNTVRVKMLQEEYEPADDALLNSKQIGIQDYPLKDLNTAKIESLLSALE